MREAAVRAARPAPKPSSWRLLHHGLVSAALGYPLSIWLSGLLVFYPSGPAQDPATYQVTMWVVPLLWAGIVGLSFLARSKAACWAWLLGANAAAAGLLHLVAR